MTNNVQSFNQGLINNVYSSDGKYGLIPNKIDLSSVEEMAKMLCNREDSAVKIQAA